MWARNLLFIGLVGGGIIALSASLFPSEKPPRVSHFDPQPIQTAEFRSVVEQVNVAFRAEWAAQHLVPAPRAADNQIYRRLSLALTGTIPSLQEFRQLETQPGDERLAWWLAGIFQDRRYSDYFAERLARAYVGTEDGPFIVYRRRRFVTWLSDELIRNRSYQSLVRELITANGLWTDQPATNFITVTIEQGKKGPNAERLAGRVARAFLGIRLDCAQCHNHPFERWKQHDFQGLAAFFGQTEQGFTGIHEGKGELELENRKTGKKEQIAPRVPFLEELLPAEGNRRERLAGWVTDARNSYFARAIVNRIWALMFGRPLHSPVDNLHTEGELPLALRLLADDFVKHDYNLQRLIQVIAATQVFQINSAAGHEITEAHEKAWAAFPITRLRPEQVIGSLEQAASVQTLNHQSHILFKIKHYVEGKDFIKRYGDTGEDEFDGHGGTIPQRLLMMNGKWTKERTEPGPLNSNASARIAALAPDDKTAVELAYLTVLTRRPTPEEAAYFEDRLAQGEGTHRNQCMEDLYWTLMNSTEFSWNH